MAWGQTQSLKQGGAHSVPWAWWLLRRGAAGGMSVVPSLEAWVGCRVLLGVLWSSCLSRSERTGEPGLLGKTHPPHVGV